jgi:hypothetical protein
VVRVGVVARGVALSITAPLSSKNVGIICTCVSRLRVETGVDEGHLLEYKSERIMVGAREL